MSNLTECKGCSASIWVKIDETYEKLKGTLIDEYAAAPKDVYENRLKICKIPVLPYSYGTTCKHCGCLVHARALGKDNYCPEPSGRKW